MERSMIQRAATLALGAAALTAAVQSASLAPWGGGEVFCDAMGTEIEEAWRNVPAAGIPWEIHCGPGNFPTRIGPNFFPIGPINAANPAQTKPGIQSILRAAETWEKTGIGGIDISSISFDEPSLYVEPNPGPGIVLPSRLYTFSSLGGVISADRILDGVNTVTLWEPAGTFLYTGLGGAGTVGAALVIVPPNGTGDIVEADITLNALTKTGPGVFDAPFYSFVESNDAAQSWYATTTELPGSGAPLAGPATAYVDLQGVLVHEFGHFLGLAHSLVDGRWNSVEGTTPTMFIAGGHTTSPFAAFASFYGGAQGPPLAELMDASTTLSRGLLAETARSLESDDLSAIAGVYPTLDLSPTLGGIRGRVGDVFGVPVLGAHVVAVKADEHDVVRVGTLSRAGGVFRIPRLPVGRYYVYVEPVDGVMFRPEGLPTYVAPSTEQCVVPTFFTTEFWDTAESGNEANPMSASILDVLGNGRYTANCDFIIERVPDRLQVEVLGSPVMTPSSRGAVAINPAGANTVLQFTLNFPSAPAPRAGFLLVGTDRRSIQVSQQLTLPALGGMRPASTLVTLNTQGDAIVNFPLDPATVHQSLFVQVMAQSPNGVGMQLSNPVTVLVAR